MSETFTKGMARNIYFGGGVFFFLVFLGLTYHTEQTFPERSNESEMTEAVVRGKAVWENNNCIAATACSVRAPTSRRSWVTSLFVAAARRASSRSCMPG